MATEEARKAAERLSDAHRRAEDTDTDAEGNRVIVEFCQECDDDWPCDESYVAEALLDAVRADLTAEIERLTSDLEFAAAFWRPVAADMEHDILSVDTVRFLAQDFLAELQRRSEGRQVESPS